MQRWSRSASAVEGEDMNTLTLNRRPWLAALLAWLARPARPQSQPKSKPVVRIAGLR
jgi:hypothetical protein